MQFVKEFRALVTQEVLRQTLQQIVEHDVDYERRNPLVLQAIGLATRLGFEAGVRVDPDEPEWPVYYIELPNGQVSWHLPQHAREWDGHDTEEKLRRVREFVEQRETPDSG